MWYHAHALHALPRVPLQPPREQLPIHLLPSLEMLRLCPIALEVVDRKILATWYSSSLRSYISNRKDLASRYSGSLSPHVVLEALLSVLFLWLAAPHILWDFFRALSRSFIEF